MSWIFMDEQKSVRLQKQQMEKPLFFWDKEPMRFLTGCGTVPYILQSFWCSMKKPDSGSWKITRNIVKDWEIQGKLAIYLKKYDLW